MSNRKHKSSQDFKNLRIENAIRKLGGKEEADKIVAVWRVHRKSEKNNDRWEIIKDIIYDLKILFQTKEGSWWIYQRYYCK